ncbi:SDR family NAD(P)-dependent oxidoreductase [Halalkalicoccus sp. NIPERK01]|uniref:SDR family NAD(P)-dependent oxidoreductase n=1 Tax=Halalkalicoccus sp. NIPERK01 TaxID=3053469 RepID=UPI00256F3F5C|nr:SDR family oxidoreductase [Halalkalicoccus sp. NIPERK01]MDL5363376.1 SDR family oxidoreductase [Halalkalicoccus sp. NIPERK01]
MSVLDTFRLDGDTAIITGGNRGIGKGIARALAEAGADIVVANRDADSGAAAIEEITAETGVDGVAIPVDITDEAKVEALVEQVSAEFGSIDILVNNAGITYNVRAEQMELDDWERVIDINLTGVFLCAKHVGIDMIENDGGSIINISSISAYIANHPQPQVGYNASKAGVEGLKTQLASEWAKYGIRVNNINPGYIRTDMVKDVLENDPKMAAEWKREMLLEDMADPDSIGALAVYLSSDASWYMTGESISIDGGYTVR